VAQVDCDVLGIAQQHIAERFPFYDLTGLKPNISDSGDLREVSFELPVDTLGGNSRGDR
jgi:hypothetical protein